MIRRPQDVLALIFWDCSWRDMCQTMACSCTLVCWSLRETQKSTTLLPWVCDSMQVLHHTHQAVTVHTSEYNSRWEVPRKELRLTQHIIDDNNMAHLHLQSKARLMCASTEAQCPAIFSVWIPSTHLWPCWEAAQKWIHGSQGVWQRTSMRAEGKTHHTKYIRSTVWCRVGERGNAAQEPSSSLKLLRMPTAFTGHLIFTELPIYHMLYFQPPN